jgi:hypothetical protein
MALKRKRAFRAFGWDFGDGRNRSTTAAYNGAAGSCSGRCFCAGLCSGVLLNAALLAIGLSVAGDGDTLRGGGSASSAGADGSVPGGLRMLEAPVGTSAPNTSSGMADGFWHVVEDVINPLALIIPATNTSLTTTDTTETTTVSHTSISSTETNSNTKTTTSRTTTSAPITVTTTSTTTTLCMTPEDGDDCYNRVIETMHSIRSNPMSYVGLNAWSSFEEVQDFLYTTKSSETKCGKSCACELLNTGSKCDRSVIYAMSEGVKQNPEDYYDLASDSTPEDFQSHLSKWVEAANCSMPCRAASWKGDPSLFCWSLAQQTGYEADVMRLQLSKGAGIFGCDGFAVASQDEWTIGQGPGGRVGEVKTIRFQGVEVGVSKDGTAGNAQLFMLAWNVILRRTTILKFDWAIKADPDAVVLVDRLRDHLRPVTGSSHFVRNCNEHPNNPEYPMMYGSLEAISQGGLELYRDEADRCVAELAWQDWGEDVFMAKCLDFLGADPIDDFSLSSDGVCLGVDCHDTEAAAFHPFKSADDWRDCWEAATAGLGGPLPPLP